MIANIILRMIGYFDCDVKRINHALKVHGFAVAIAGGESISGEERTVIELAAILHDIGIKEAERKYNSTAGKYQEIEGPPIARAILDHERVPAPISDRVCFLIGNHHSYGKIVDNDFQILVESDFLVNIFEDSVKREKVENIEKEYFRTLSGKKIIRTIYLN